MIAWEPTAMDKDAFSWLSRFGNRVLTEALEQIADVVARGQPLHIPFIFQEVNGVLRQVEAGFLFGAVGQSDHFDGNRRIGIVVVNLVGVGGHIHWLGRLHGRMLAQVDQRFVQTAEGGHLMALAADDELLDLF